MPALPQSNIHLDILMGRDESLGVSDFFGGGYLPLDSIPYLPKSRKVWRASHRWTSTAIWGSHGCNITKGAPVLPNPQISTLVVLAPHVVDMEDDYNLYSEYSMRALRIEKSLPYLVY